MGWPERLSGHPLVRLPVIGGCAVLLLVGCGQASARGPRLVPAPGVPTVAPATAAEAGGACQLLDFTVISELLGMRFDVAAATDSGQTHTCVVQSSEASLPDLALTVSPATADDDVLREEVAPDGALAVKGLGTAAYRGSVPASGDQGPAVEVGWLSGDSKLITLRLTLAEGQPRSAARDRSTRLVSLAKRVDAARA